MKVLPCKQGVRMSIHVSGLGMWSENLWHVFFSSPVTCSYTGKEELGSFEVATGISVYGDEVGYLRLCTAMFGWSRADNSIIRNNETDQNMRKTFRSSSSCSCVPASEAAKPLTSLKNQWFYKSKQATVPFG